MNRVKLGDICFVQGGYAFKSTEFKESGVPLIRISNIGDHRVNINKKTVYLTKEWLEKRNSFKLNKGDILIALSGATTGKYGIWESDSEALLNQRVGRIVINEELVFPPYIYFYMSKIQSLILKKAYGAAIPNISPTDIGEIEIPLPPLSEQKRIASVLDKADQLRQSDRALINKYDELVQSLFLEMFGDPFNNPKGFEKGTVRDLITEAKYGTSKKAEEGGHYPYLRMNNITYKGGWDFTSLKYINLTDAEKPKYLIQKGDLIFNRTNSKELVGKTAVYRRNEEVVIAGYLIRVRTNEKANPEFIAGYLNSRHGKLTLQNMCKNIVGMANINAQELQDIKILMPPIDLQNQFALIVEQIEQQKALAEQAAQKSEELFQALLQRAFKGELFEKETAMA